MGSLQGFAGVLCEVCSLYDSASGFCGVGYVAIYTSLFTLGIYVCFGTHIHLFVYEDVFSTT